MPEETRPHPTKYECQFIPSLDTCPHAQYHNHSTNSYILTGVLPEIFESRGGFFKLGHSDKHFVKHSRKKGPAWKNFEVSSHIYS